MDRKTERADEHGAQLRSNREAISKEIARRSVKNWSAKSAGVGQEHKRRSCHTET